MSERKEHLDHIISEHAEETTISVRTFTSWKLGLLDALVVGLDSREFRLAFCLLQFADSTTRAIFPSQARIAALLGCHESSVKRAIAAMIDLGVLQSRRKNMRVSNAYAFVESKRDELEKTRKIREAEFLASRWGWPEVLDLPPQLHCQADKDGSEVSRQTDVDSAEPDRREGLELPPQKKRPGGNDKSKTNPIKDREGAKVSHPDRADLPLRVRAGSNHKHLHESPSVNNADGSASDAARGRGPLVVSDELLAKLRPVS